MTKQLILLVSPGTAAQDNRKSARTGIKRTVAEQFPGWELREAFTSIINEALEKAEAESVRRLIVQPLHLMHGREYAKVVCALRERGRYFAQVVLGEPLLSSDADFAAVLLAVIRRTAEFDDGRTAVCLVGHGSGGSLEANADDIYIKMQKKLIQAGYKNYYVGVLKGKPSLEDIRNALKGDFLGKYRRVVLLPFMIEAGSHAKRDVAGAWKRELERDGYEVVCILEGLGQIRQVQKLYAQHIRDCEKMICTGCADTFRKEVENG